METITGRIFRTTTYNGVTKAHIYRGGRPFADLRTDVELAEWTGPGKDQVWLKLSIQNNVIVAAVPA